MLFSLFPHLLGRFTMIRRAPGVRTHTTHFPTMDLSMQPVAEIVRNYFLFVVCMMAAKIIINLTGHLISRIAPAGKISLRITSVSFEQVISATGGYTFSGPCAVRSCDRDSSCSRGGCKPRRVAGEAKEVEIAAANLSSRRELRFYYQNNSSCSEFSVHLVNGGCAAQRYY